MTTYEKLAQQINILNDIESVDSEFTGIDTLIKLRGKYEKISTCLFNVVRKNSPQDFENRVLKTLQVEKNLNGLIEKFQKDTIDIAVVAEVSSGKSTFLNALIFGDKILDAKMGETTAKLFKIKYGNEDIKVLKKKIEDLNTNALKDIEKNKNLGHNEEITVEKIKNEYLFELEANNPNLQKGIVLYDTPGFGTLNEKVMIELVKYAVGTSHAVILLLDISKGLKDNEAIFVERVLPYIKEDKRFIILNKFDSAVSEDEDEDDIQQQINKVVSDTKRDLLKISLKTNNNPNAEKHIQQQLDDQTFYLSALKALTGKTKNKDEVLEFSRFPIFEEQFWKRIVEAKKGTFQTNVEDLVSKSAEIVDKVKENIASLEQSTRQQQAIADNMEKVGKEIKAVIDQYQKVFQTINKNLSGNHEFAYEKITQFESDLKLFIRTTVESNINLIPEENVTEKNFIDASKKIETTINEHIKNSFMKLVGEITTEISQYKMNVNNKINDLNKEIKSEKFAKLHLEQLKLIDGNEISSVSADNVKAETKDEILKNIANNTLNELGFFTSQTNNSYSSTVSSLTSSKEKEFDKTGLVVSATVGAMELASAGTIGGVAASTASAIGLGGSTVAAAGALAGPVAIGAGLLYAGYKYFQNKRDEAHQKELAEMEARSMKRQADMLKNFETKLNEIKKEEYKRQIREAKKDFKYDVSSNLIDNIGKILTSFKSKANNSYRSLLTEISTVSINAEYVLKDMKSIIEDPTAIKKIVEDNNKKIHELTIFSNKIEKCFN